MHLRVLGLAVEGFHFTHGHKSKSEKREALEAECGPAAEQGREVLAVPGSPLDPRAKGTNDLIRQGAALCEGAEDVLRALEGLRGFREPERGDYAAGPTPDPDDSLRREVAALLSPTPVSRDEIVRATGAAAPAVFAALVELSLAGRCELLPGGMIAAT